MAAGTEMIKKKKTQQGLLLLSCSLLEFATSPLFLQFALFGENCHSRQCQGQRQQPHCPLRLDPSTSICTQPILHPSPTHLPLTHPLSIVLSPIFIIFLLFIPFTSYSSIHPSSFLGSCPLCLLLTESKSPTRRLQPPWRTPHMVLNRSSQPASDLAGKIHHF